LTSGKSDNTINSIHVAKDKHSYTKYGKMYDKNYNGNLEFSEHFSLERDSSDKSLFKDNLSRLGNRNAKVNKDECYDSKYGLDTNYQNDER
jgi:hypothetical protein